MLIIFNKSGNEFVVDYQYDSFSQGDSNTHIVDVVVEDTAFSNYDYNAYVQFLRNGESSPSPKLIMATKKIIYNDVSYNGFTFAMASDWYTAIAGTLKMTIEIKKFTNGALQENKAYGVVNIPVQESVSAIAEVDTEITDEEYASMVELINAKLNKDDYVIYDVGIKTSRENIALASILHKMENPTSNYVYKGQLELFGGAGTTDYFAIAGTDGIVGWVTIIGWREIKSYEYDEPNLTESKTNISQVITKTISVLESIIVPTPTADNHAVNRKYVTDNYYTNVEVDEELDLKANDSEVVHLAGNEKVTGIKTFAQPIHIKNSMPYVISDTSGKVGMRAYVNDDMTGGIAGQFAISNSAWDDEGGHFANIQAYDSDGNPHSLKVSKKGVYFDNNKMATQQWAIDYVDVQIENIIDRAPETLDTFKEIADYIASDTTATAQMTANIQKNKNNITALDNTKANRSELFSKDYDELINAPEKINIVVRDVISADTYNEAREIQIGKDKFKFGSGSKIKANEFVDGTLPTLEYLNIDGNTYKLPNYVVDKSGLKLVEKASIQSYDDFSITFQLSKPLEHNKLYYIERYDAMGDYMFETIIQTSYDYVTTNMLVLDDNSGNCVLGQLVIMRNQYDEFDNVTIFALPTNEEDFVFSLGENYDYIEIYEIPLGESAQVEKHNKTINALMQRVSDLEQKAGLISVGYVQDNTLNLIRVNVVDDVLEVSGFKFDGEVMII